MSLKSLKQGQIIKNYIALCELLNVKPTKSSKGRKYHFREFERYCAYHKEGQKIIVDEIYDIPKEKVDGRKNNGGHIANTTYDDLMDRLLVNLIYELDDRIDITFSELFSYNIPLFTKNYQELLESGYISFSKKHAMSKGLVLLYQQKIKNIVQKCFETSLNRLQKEDVIKWEKNIKYMTPRQEEDFADEELTVDIKKAEGKAYEKLKMTHFDRINPDKNREFKKAVCKELDDVISYWNIYSIELLCGMAERTESDMDELIRRFIDSIHNAVRNKTCIDDFGRKYNPYMSLTNQHDTCRLDRLIWNLPEDYASRGEENNFNEDIEEDKYDYENCIPF